MIRYIIKRLLWMIPVVLGVAILVFTIMEFVPGDQVTIMIGGSATPAEQEAMREMLGLNRPFLVRLGEYLKNLIFHFDFGTSYIYGNSVASDIMDRFPRTAMIAFISSAFATIVGIPIGIYAATHQDKTGDRVALIASMFFVSMPNFWLALILVIVFSLKLGWLPNTGIGSPAHYVLPMISLLLGSFANEARQTRSGMLEVIRSDYIITARAKGVSERNVLYKHALPNALIPIITNIGTHFGRSLGGTLILETVFSIPGLGTYLMSGINNRDYNAVQGTLIFLAIMFSIVMLLTDLVYAFIDPRIKAQYENQSKKRRKRTNAAG